LSFDFIIASANAPTAVEVLERRRKEIRGVREDSITGYARSFCFAEKKKRCNSDVTIYC